LDLFEWQRLSVNRVTEHWQLLGDKNTAHAQGHSLCRLVWYKFVDGKQDGSGYCELSDFGDRWHFLSPFEGLL
jgi:hypothetical protein